VSPSAAYRHLADHRALVVAVALAAQDLLADAIREGMATHAGDDAAGALRGVGIGYISFALSEPGWFELALLTFDPAQSQATVRVANQVPPPFQLLLDALDGMVASGALTPAEREHAEWPCWSAVHGFADIATRGPLQAAPPETVRQLGAHVVDRAIAGLKHT
jgi:AcrR family transcriptional regulator